MHNSIKRYEDISNLIKLKLEDKKINKFPKIIAVSKTFSIEKILPLIEYGHTDYGENKVQEAVDKWTKIKIDNSNIKLHMIGKLQTNKVKFAIQIFDFIHSVDSKKLAKKISDEQIKQNRKLKLFIQVNIGNEEQKAGIDKSELVDLYKYCKELNLNVIGLMCIPPVNENVEKYFIQTNLLNKELNLFELSMGMSSDYLKAVEHSSSYLRIGSSIFGKR
ncbi:MAG: YggS family pyridoxal phosphate-dependent enzyme, partial [Candidatus Marinimicrobia bacterium]|nr:YggS family pyridoxal phosphate-dependent enzyme [Candidatus Neomarinimicrobiota bacterium]